MTKFQACGSHEFTCIVSKFIQNTVQQKCYQSSQNMYMCTYHGRLWYNRADLTTLPSPETWHHGLEVRSSCLRRRHSFSAWPQSPAVRPGASSASLTRFGPNHWARTPQSITRVGGPNAPLSICSSRSGSQPAFWTWKRLWTPLMWRGWEPSSTAQYPSSAKFS